MPTPDDTSQRRQHDKKYSLSQPAKDAYEVLTTGREAVCDMGRKMAELTIPSVFPPRGYKAGDDLPGNNHSVGAQAVNTLASKLMFMAFPPGQPIMTLEPVETKLQKQIDEDKELYARVMLALSRLEVSHRKRFQLTSLATAYVGYMKLLIIGGNALWKHLKLNSPTYHRPDCYVVSRDSGGHPLVMIHKETVRVTTLDDDIQDVIYAETPELLKMKEWEREVDIYSTCRLVMDGDEPTWEFWQEYEDEALPGTEVTVDYDNPPMWAGWMIPVYGDNWGRSYCEEYRGDLFTLEAQASGLNDGAALAAWALTFVKPGSRTSIRQVMKAKNLSILSGSAEDMSVFRSDKTADLNFVANTFAAAARRIGAAFLLQSAVMRDGERVTKEEVMRVGQELDQAMGGLYTEIAQGHQRRILMRAIRLHEEDNKDLPPIPDGIIEVGVITGIDAMGKSSDATELHEFGLGLNQVFGPGAAAKTLSITDFATRFAAYKGIKPDGLVKSQQDVDAQDAADQQRALGASVAEKAAGPVAGALAGGLMQQQQPQADQPQQ